VPPHVSFQPEVPKNDGWKEIVHPTVSQHRGWPHFSLPFHPPINQIVQAAPIHSPFQCSHARKRLKIEAHHAPDKGKATAAPSSPSNGFDKSMSSRMHLRDNCSHVINKIRPKGLNQRKIQRDQMVTTETREGLHLRVENMVFEFLFYLLLMIVDFKSFGQHVLFEIYE
jgi:hypothetical protein